MGCGEVSALKGGAIAALGFGGRFADGGTFVLLELPAASGVMFEVTGFTGIGAAGTEDVAAGLTSFTG